MYGTLIFIIWDIFRHVAIIKRLFVYVQCYSIVFGEGKVIPGPKINVVTHFRPFESTSAAPAVLETIPTGKR